MTTANLLDAPLTAAATPRQHPEPNAYEATLTRYERAVELLDVDPGIDPILRQPEKEITVAVPVEMDNDVASAHRLRGVYAWTSRNGSVQTAV